MKYNLLIGAAAVLLFMNACSTRMSMIPKTSISGLKGQFHSGQIIEMETGKILSFDQLVDRLASRKLIFVGEVHNNPEHHLIQVQLLQALVMRHGSLSVAMESFQRPQQPIIDRYIHGDLTEGEFLEELNWRRGWGYDYYLYRPLILLAKEKGIPIYAINAPAVIVRKVARSGLSGLTVEERRQLAEVIDLGNQKHRSYVREAYKAHEHGELKNFEYFYQAQCVWEDTMAESLASRLERHGNKLVVITGNGHIIYKFGVPDRTYRRLPVPMATVLLYPLAGSPAPGKRAADYVWLTGTRPTMNPRMPQGIVRP